MFRMLLAPVFRVTFSLCSETQEMAKQNVLTNVHIPEHAPRMQPGSCWISPPIVCREKVFGPNSFFVTSIQSLNNLRMVSMIVNLNSPSVSSPELLQGSILVSAPPSFPSPP